MCVVCALCVCVCVCIYEWFVSVIVVVSALSPGVDGVWRSEAGSCECVCCVCVCVFVCGFTSGTCV